MGSSRLPGKSLSDIAGKPMVQRVMERVSAASLLEKVVLATTVLDEDAPLCSLARHLDVACYRGDADDVLDRYYQAAQQFGSRVIVRITADCPLIDPDIIDRAISAFLPSGYDYVSTSYPTSTFPDGEDVEVFSFGALEQAWREASLLSEREHVTPYIWKNPQLFKLGSVPNTEDLSALRWTVDEERDLAFVREVYRHLDKEGMFGMADILALLQAHPELAGINQGINRNEGYEKSLRTDRQVRQR